MKRRDFLKLAGLAAGTSFTAGWPLAGRAVTGPGPVSCSVGEPGGLVRHFLATAGPDRILAKASFAEPLTGPPLLRVGSRRVWGTRTDGETRFFRFDVSGLAPGTRYELSLSAQGCEVIEPWQFSTLPAPDAAPSRLRLLFYTCAGGHDLHRLYLPIETRQRFLRRALDFEPDAVVAVGDHVYWDLRSLPSAFFQGQSPVSIDFAGEFDRDAPIFGHPNEFVLKKTVDGQLADLYGTLLRGVPVFFVRDDHDYFEDDRAGDDLVTFPADAFMRALARATQHLYYPEYLPDATRPIALPGTKAYGPGAGLSEAFGTLRWGRLAELLLYDCKGFATLEGVAGGLVPPAIESWLLGRIASGDAEHVVNVPSNPVGYSAGKYAEWYPDVVDGGVLTDAIEKYGWQGGWFEQHQRLLAAASQRGGIAAFLSGDIHSIAESRILRSGALDLTDNPIVSLVSGTPGCRYGWPSLARNGVAAAPTAIESEDVVPVEERNGFQIVDLEPGRLTIRHFHWNVRADPVESIDSLEPFHVSEYTS